MATVAPVTPASSSMSSSVSGDPSRSTTSSRVKSRPRRMNTGRKTPTESRPVRRAHSDEGFEEMALKDGDDSAKSFGGPLSNRQRTAKMAKMNASVGSLDYTHRSDSSGGGSGGGAPSKSKSSRGRTKRTTINSRRSRSSSPILDKDNRAPVTSARRNNSSVSSLDYTHRSPILDNDDEAPNSSARKNNSSVNSLDYTHRSDRKNNSSVNSLDYTQRSDTSISGTGGGAPSQSKSSRGRIKRTTVNSRRSRSSSPVLDKDDGAPNTSATSKSRGRIKRITYNSKGSRSSSPVLFDDEDGATITSAATSISRRGRRGGHGRSGRRPRSTSEDSGGNSRSRSREPVQSSKTPATGTKTRRAPSRSVSGDSLRRPGSGESKPRSKSIPRPDKGESTIRTDNRSSRRPRKSRGDNGALPPISPVPASRRNSDSSSPRGSKRYSNRISETDLLNPPLSTKSESGVKASKKFPEEELMSFLRAHGKESLAEELHKSGILSFDDEIEEEAPTSRRERASQRQRERNRDRDSEKPRSQRRERTVGGGVSSGSRGESGGRRPPRSRGVSRSYSDAPAAVAAEAMGVSPRPGGSPREAIPKPPRSGRREPTERGVRRNRSADDVDLGLFLAANTAPVSRRRKPGSGSRSVASVPMKPRRRRPGTPSSTGDDDEDKPPSNRTAVTAPVGYTSSSEDDDNDSFAEEVGDFGVVDLNAALQAHMSRTENLLFDVFPKHIAEALREGKKVEPENHPCVTIFFSDIVGFTNISSTLDPLKVSDMLDRLYSSFDALSHYHDVFKVETIGDAYMAVTNLTKEQPDHTKRIAEFSVDAIRVANKTLVDKDDPSKGYVNIRVGFHSGPVVSNVVGSRNPRFCLFGDTVNTASRMESNSLANRIHCSPSAAELLKVQDPDFKLNPRGTIEVKGKGAMSTFWVNEDAASESQRNGNRRSIFRLLRKNRRGSMQ